MKLKLNMLKTYVSPILTLSFHLAEAVLPPADPSQVFHQISSGIAESYLELSLVAVEI